jgi:hypothetical protein
METFIEQMRKEIASQKESRDYRKNEEFRKEVDRQATGIQHIENSLRCGD